MSKSLKIIIVTVSGLLGLLIIAGIFGGALVNGYCKGKMERVFAEAHPGYALRIGELDYSIASNQIAASSVTLSASNLMFKAGRISLTGVRWERFLWGKRAPADFLAEASLDAADLDMKLLKFSYGVRCARLHASAQDSELIAEKTELSPLIQDEELFAASAFRTTRLHILAPVCRVSGLAYKELFEGKSYRARSVYLLSPAFEVLVNRDKPVAPLKKSPLMLHEALAEIREPLDIDSLIIANGYLKYCERVVRGAAPGEVVISSVNFSIGNLANRGDSSAAILITAQGKLMNAGILKIRMTIPVASRDFSMHYSGSLGAMDLTRLDAFLDIAERIRIKTGSVQGLKFNVDVSSGLARGFVRASYKDFKIAALDTKTDTEYGLDNQFATFMANTFKFRSSNSRELSGSMKEGKINYTRKPGDEFTQFVWFALRSGILDIVSQ